MDPITELMNPEADTHIRNALRLADENGKLGVIAAVTGISGGETELRKIMESEGELHIMDRGMLLIHLTAPVQQRHEP